MAGWWVDAAGAPPHGYVAVQCGARVASRWSPNRLIVGSGCEVSNLAGEVGDVLLVWPGNYPRRDSPESCVERVGARAAVLLRVSGVL
jgi:hypothetical protein